MKFNFHCAGSISKEEMSVIYANDDVIVLSDCDDILDQESFELIDKEKHSFAWGNDYWIFNRLTGECLNDNTAFGCKRTIDVA